MRSINVSNWVPHEVVRTSGGHGENCDFCGRRVIWSKKESGRMAEARVTYFQEAEYYDCVDDCSYCCVGDHEDEFALLICEDCARKLGGLFSGEG